jgi:hypothetical protein
MPTAMTYAIDTILRLCEENTRLRLKYGEEKEEENIQLEVMDDDDKIWETLHKIGMKTICQYLREEHSFHIYKEERDTLEEVERLKESADLIAESQQKQIDRLNEENAFLKTQLKELTDAMIETKAQLKTATETRGVGRPKKTECSPCIADPSP